MSRICILVCSLFLNGLFSSGQPNSVSASDSLLEDGPVGVLYRTKIREAIKVSSTVLGSWKPLSIFTPLDETCSINQTADSFDVRILTSKTVASITGGIFGPDVYQFHKFSIFWKNGPTPNTTEMESRVYFFNLKYGTFENALDHSDGVILQIYPVAITDNCPNPLFDGLSIIMQKKIKAAGDYTEVHSGFTYRWYVNFPFGSIYYTYKTVLKDEETGKKYTAVVVLLPTDPKTNFLSWKQYKSTFGNIQGACDSPEMQEFAPSNVRTTKTPIETHKGIVVLNLPA